MSLALAARSERLESSAFASLRVRADDVRYPSVPGSDEAADECDAVDDVETEEGVEPSADERGLGVAPRAGLSREARVGSVGGLEAGDGGADVGSGADRVVDREEELREPGVVERDVRVSGRVDGLLSVAWAFVFWFVGKMTS